MHLISGSLCKVGFCQTFYGQLQPGMHRDSLMDILCPVLAKILGIFLPLVVTGQESVNEVSIWACL